VRCDLEAADECPGGDDGSIDGREQFERVDPVQPLELGDTHVQHAVLDSHEVDPALDRPAKLDPGTGRSPGKGQRRVVFVDVTSLEDDDRHRVRHGDRRIAERVQIVSAQAPSLRPARTADGEVPGEDPADQRIGRAATRDDPLESHAPLGPGLSGRERPRSPASCRPRPSRSGTPDRRGCRC
jgi:hypothetical protein